MIQLHVYEEIFHFKEDVTPFLEKNEQENNLILYYKWFKNRYLWG